MIGKRRRSRTRLGRWTSSMISSPPARRLGCSPWSTHSLASPRSLIHASAIELRMWCNHSSGSAAAIGYPKTIRVDQGSEFISRDMDLWAYAKGVTLDFSRPGKPTDNAYIEAFNGRFRAECLNAHWFLTLADAAEKMEDWRRYYNEERPHGARGQSPPITLLNPEGAPTPPP